MQTQTPDYTSLYTDYWSRDDRWQSHSFTDPDLVVEQILTLGRGDMLDVGCGMGKLVLTLRDLGINARGVDIAQRPVDKGNDHAPGSFKLGSILDIPYPNNSVDTVFSTDVLEHLDEADVPTALSELCRVTRRSLYACIATRMDRDKFWHLTVEGRKWWEDRFFEAGMRKHPATMSITPYEKFEKERLAITVTLEKIPQAAFEKYPIESLLADPDGPMDMLRVSGRRSDAHIARYQLARRHVREGSTVLDIGCGMGYGAAILSYGTGAKRVVGVDRCGDAIEYAAANYSDPYQTEFRVGDALDLSFLDDGSVDLAVSFGMLHSLEDPQELLAQMRRVLRPGGRAIVSVPNQWVDQTGSKLDKSHKHIYDWDMLKEQIEGTFDLHAAFGQTAGGGMVLQDSPRRIASIDPGYSSAVDAEWWIGIGIKR